VEIRYPPIPEYLERGERQTHDYQVVFWTHQFPPPGHIQEQMGWAELTWDIQDAEDVYEVIAWAESYLHEFAAEHPGAQHSYCVYAKVPGEDWLLHIGGVNPSANPHRETFRRMHPFDQVKQLPTPPPSHRSTSA
jgi:hypothetical protein